MIPICIPIYIYTAAVVVNEVASAGNAQACPALQDHVELYNTDLINSVDIGGYILADPSANFTIPINTIIAAGGYLLYCEDQPNSFTFGISGTDSITLYFSNGTLASTSGPQTSLGSATSTFQRKPDGTYAYSTPSPLAPNVFSAPPLDVVVVNEVADKGTFLAACGGNITLNVAGEDWVELFNTSPNTAVNISGYQIRDDNPTNAPLVIPSGTIIPPNGFLLYCGVKDFVFGIGGTDTISLLDGNNVTRSTTGVLKNGGSSVLTYQRKADGSGYAYAKPTPLAVNAFVSTIPANTIVVNEVASTGVPGTCNTEDYVELFYNTVSTSAVPFNLSGFVLHDDKGPLAVDRYTFPPSATILPGQYIVICTPFGIGGTDSVTLLDGTGAVVSESGKLPGGGSATLTYQRSPANTYNYAFPTPGMANIVEVVIFSPVINEVAPAGVSNKTASVCNGEPFVEIRNMGSNILNLVNFTLHNAAGASSPSAYRFPASTPTIPLRGYGVFCKGATFTFDIANNDTLTLRSPTGQDLSTTGAIGSGNAVAKPNAKDLVWVRVTDLITVGPNPVSPFYQYSTNPTPGADNIYAFTPLNATTLVQACGVQTAALPCLADYAFGEKLLLNKTGVTNPELSGGAFDGTTCQHLMIGDEGSITEVVLNGTTSSSTLQVKRSIPVFGGVRDTEGICVYSPGKVAIIEERDRTGTTIVCIDMRDLSLLDSTLDLCLSHLCTLVSLNFQTSWHSGPVRLSGAYAAGSHFPRRLQLPCHDHDGLSKDEPN